MKRRVGFKKPTYKKCSTRHGRIGGPQCHVRTTERAAGQMLKMNPKGTSNQLQRWVGLSFIYRRGRETPDRIMSTPKPQQSNPVQIKTVLVVVVLWGTYACLSQDTRKPKRSSDFRVRTRMAVPTSVCPELQLHYQKGGGWGCCYKRQKWSAGLSNRKIRKASQNILLFLFCTCPKRTFFVCLSGRLCPENEGMRLPCQNTPEGKLGNSPYSQSGSTKKRRYKTTTLVHRWNLRVVYTVSPDFFFFNSLLLHHSFFFSLAYVSLKLVPSEK